MTPMSPDNPNRLPDPSPLSEATPHSLADLMAMDPLKLTRTNRDAIVAEFRRMRAVWATAEAAGKRMGTAKAPKAKGTAPELSLDELLK